MDQAIDLRLEELEIAEAPLSDMEWGVAVGAAFGIGLWIGVAVAT